MLYFTLKYANSSKILNGFINVKSNLKVSTFKANAKNTFLLNNIAIKIAENHHHKNKNK